MSNKKFIVFHKPPAECEESEMTLRVLQQEGVQPDVLVNVADEGADLSILHDLRNAALIGDHFPVLIVLEDGVATQVRDEPTQESHVRDFLRDNKLYERRRRHTVELITGGTAEIEAMRPELDNQVFVPLGRFMLAGVYQSDQRHAVYFYLRDTEGVYRCIGDTIFRSREDGNIVWTLVPYNKRGDDLRRALAFLADHLHVPTDMVNEPNINLLIIPGFVFGE